MRNREKILQNIKRQQEKDALQDLEPEKLKIIQENINTPASQESPGPVAAGPVDKTIPRGRHEFENLVEAYQLKYGISKLDALQKVTREHPAVHRAYLQFHNPNKQID